MTNTYTVFFDYSDVFNYVVIKCTSEEFIDTLINEELIEEKEELSELDWLILKNGELMMEI